MSSPLRTLGLGALALAVAGAASLGGAMIHAHSYKLRRRSILIGEEDVPGAKPLRIVHISDVHLSVRDNQRIDFLRDMATLDPDLVVVTGDLIAEAAAIPVVLDALGPLLDKPGVFVFGSNDYYAPRPKNPLSYFAGPSSHDDDRIELPWRELAAGLTERGWLDLTNTRGELQVRGWDLSFVGVDDPHMERDVFPAADPAKPAPTGGPALHIGVAHAPYSRVLDQFVDDGCSLIFAGHTHGGQVCPPGGRALVTNCDLPAKYVRGLFEWPVTEDPVLRGDGFVAAIPQSEAAAWVQVSGGIGTSPFAPIRTFCPPEFLQLDVLPV